MKKLNIVVVGVRFGGAFVPLYLNHPDVQSVGICDTNSLAIQNMINRYGDTFKVYQSFAEVLDDDKVDAVHILTPPMLHAEMTVKALNAGKHVACAVTMGTSLKELKDIIEAVKKSGKKYAMMETAIFTRNFLYAKRMCETGELGDVQFLKSEYYQDVEGLQDHWIGYPPMLYATHAIAPLAFLAQSKVKTVYCVGSGSLPEEMVKRYGNPYAVETAIIEFENGFARSFNGVGKDYIEQFDVYGSQATFEWQQINWIEKPVVYKIAPSRKDEHGRYIFRKVDTLIIEPEDFPLNLPEPLVPYLRPKEYHEVLNPDKTYIEGGDHHGALPHLVHDFVRAIIEDRKPICDEYISANICAAGILAHQSALNDGVRLQIPEF
ncbi:MAG: Gfo/Idh/MocA family oxidoreductase [Bacilli bacterium]|nr:Gfo/Idh/MocA family oxidoreductase [Bacilli bacterium]